MLSTKGRSTIAETVPDLSGQLILELEEAAANYLLIVEGIIAKCDPETMIKLNDIGPAVAERFISHFRD